jgi:hypothetical protein
LGGDEGRQKGRMGGGARVVTVCPSVAQRRRGEELFQGTSVLENETIQHNHLRRLTISFLMYIRFNQLKLFRWC